MIYTLYKALKPLVDTGKQIKRDGLWGYMEMTTVDPRLERVKTILIGEAFFWEPVSQNSYSWQEALCFIRVLMLHYTHYPILICS